MISPEQVSRETGGRPIPIVEFEEDPKEFLETKIHTDKTSRWLKGAEWLDVFSQPNEASVGDSEAQYQTLMRIGRCRDDKNKHEYTVIETVGKGPTGKWQTLVVQKRFLDSEISTIVRNLVLDEVISSYVKTGQEEA